MGECKEVMCKIIQSAVKSMMLFYDQHLPLSMLGNGMMPVFWQWVSSCQYGMPDVAWVLNILPPGVLNGPRTRVARPIMLAVEEAMLRHAKYKGRVMKKIKV
jgi:hypothetical protein